MHFNVETVIGNLRSVFRMPTAEVDGIRLELLRQNFGHHYEKNAYFKALCDKSGVSLYDLQDIADIARIPLIPMRQFKSPNSHILLSVPLNEVELEIKSTGTSGIPSVTRRDPLTVDRISMGILGLYREFFGISRGAGLFLAPSLGESPEMGMVKALNMMAGLFSDASYLVRDYAFYPEDALAYLRSFAGRETRHILGPPFLVNRLLRHMEEEDIELHLDPDSFIITIGGWKRFSGEFISRTEMEATIQRRLGLAPNRMRDMYGMVESNMLAVECEYNRKHMPPWCHLSVRQIDDTSREVARGEEGVIALLDAACLSYPGFVLSEDIGCEILGDCPCDRSGPVLTFHRRVDGGEYGCCAVSLEKFIESREIVEECKVD